ncbi:hypothetical protein BpHYR1_019202 [Brachionus plicatilis]|uniref:Uncharacterized protein n=1 Tax=Brachionus plicatilis TaxID=10195 RepID=A0A3M7S5Q9_BRAPC|nr:hypothetical protein BpHYR1_019202 [Brachionus plicatilis]
MYFSKALASVSDIVIGRIRAKIYLKKDFLTKNEVEFETKKILTSFENKSIIKVRGQFWF